MATKDDTYKTRAAEIQAAIREMLTHSSPADILSVLAAEVTGDGADADRVAVANEISLLAVTPSLWTRIEAP